MRRRNPFNATKPAEWDSMSKAARKRWNRTHWRPDQWKCDLALKKEATRQANRSKWAGRGLVGLAERLVERSNPGKKVCRRVPVSSEVYYHLASGRRLRRAFDYAIKSKHPKMITRFINPYPNEHSARLHEPTTMLPSSFRRKNVKGGTIGLIMGKPIFGRKVMTLQAVRFRAAHWSPTEARMWLRSHHLKPIGFEAATNSRAKAWAAEGVHRKRSKTTRHRSRRTA